MRTTDRGSTMRTLDSLAWCSTAFHKNEGQCHVIDHTGLQSRDWAAREILLNQEVSRCALIAKRSTSL